MKKVITIVIALTLLVCPVSALAAPDYSNLSDAELEYLIETAQAELEARRAAALEDTGNEAGTDEGADDPFDAQFMEQPLYVSEARFRVQSDQYKSLYPDVLQAIIVNNSQDDIKDATIAFAAWDSNNLPVMIKAQFDFSPAVYVKKAKYTGINLVPGGTFGESNGLKLDEGISGIVTVKAVVVSYETFDGKTWDNPLYDEFVEKYEGKKLIQ